MAIKKNRDEEAAEAAPWVVYEHITVNGPGKVADSGKRSAPAVKVGDEVYYGKYSGTEVEIDGKKFVIARENDILGILEK